MTDETTNTDRHDLITPAKLLAWNMHWTDVRISDYFAGRNALSAREIAADTMISPQDRMWVLTNALACKDIWLPYHLALWCAERAQAKLTPKWQTKLGTVFEQVWALCGDHREADVASATRAAWTAAADPSHPWAVVRAAAGCAARVVANAVAWSNALAADTEDARAMCAMCATRAAADAADAARVTSIDADDTDNGINEAAREHAVFLLEFGETWNKRLQDGK